METVKSAAEYMAEIDALKREVVALQHERDELIAERDRWKQHATGGHPWPCARFCESKAYQLKIRELESELGKVKLVIVKCRDAAMRQVIEARIPECALFGEIAQDLDWVCGQLSSEKDGAK